MEPGDVALGADVSDEGTGHMISSLDPGEVVELRLETGEPDRLVITVEDDDGRRKTWTLNLAGLHIFGRPVLHYAPGPAGTVLVPGRLFGANAQLYLTGILASSSPDGALYAVATKEGE